MDRTPIEKLVFVYNANSGARNAILDSVHKVVSPSTYDCNLCSITYGLFNEKVDWKKFRSNAGMEMEFLHRDEFESEYASKFQHKFTYPIVLAAVNEQLQVLIHTAELNELKEVDQLIKLIESRAVTD